MSNLEFFKAVAANGDSNDKEFRFIYPSAIAKALGFRLVEAGPGTATIEGPYLTRGNHRVRNLMRENALKTFLFLR